MLPPPRRLVERALLVREDPDLAAPEERLDPLDDFARDEPDLVAPPLVLVRLLLALDALPDERAPLLRDVAALPDDFAVLLREEDDFAARDEAPELFEPDEPDELPVLLERPEPPLEAELVLSVDHLPVITRCAASATASAISDPSLVALESMLPAARSAVSAASRPASRIFLRAAGLALIAAAAAASPAASISLLIAALASLSTELSFDFDELDDFDEEVEFFEPDREEVLRAALAMCRLPPLCEERHLKAVPVP